MRSSNAVLFAAALLVSGAADCAEYPAFADGLLTLPRVDGFDQVGKYQDVIFELTPQGTFGLTGIQVLDSGKLFRAPVESVEVIKTAAVPVSVYLRARGTQSSCGFSGPERIHQRLSGTRFEVAISTPIANEIGTFLCTADIRPFTTTIPLQVYGLSAGSYTYNVNGITGTFSLEAKNSFADDCDAASNARCQ